MFVKSIASDVDAATAAARQTIDASLLQLHDRFGQRVDGQVQRIAQRFAMIAAAGELAAAYRVLAWRLGSCFDAVWAVFEEWVDARGTLGAQEDVEAVRAVVAYLERHGDSRSRSCAGAHSLAERPPTRQKGKTASRTGRATFFMEAVRPARRLSLLFLKLGLFPSGPRHPGQDGDPDCLPTHTLRRCESNTSFGRIASDMQVLDALAHDLDVNSTDVQDFSIHSGSSGSRRSFLVSQDHSVIFKGAPSFSFLHCVTSPAEWSRLAHAAVDLNARA